MQIVHDAPLRGWHAARLAEGDQAGLLLEHRLLDLRGTLGGPGPGTRACCHDGAPLAAAEHWAAADPDQRSRAPPVAQGVPGRRHPAGAGGKKKKRGGCATW
ncbi:hypothetical protein LT493_32055 [Streptomyces tricolor]|nr:hypothetical protein [Streptomyces tricolor]